MTPKAAIASGGSRETAVNAFTVAPWGAASPWQVTTVTPVAKWPRQVLSSRESRDTGLPPQ